MTAACPSTCTQEGRLSRIEAQMEMLAKQADRTTDQFREILDRLNEIKVIEKSIISQSQAMDRAFKAIEEAKAIAESNQRELEAHINRIRGMTMLAVGLWTVLGGSLLYVAEKVLK